MSTDWKQKIVISLRCATTTKISTRLQLRNLPFFDFKMPPQQYNSLQKPQLDLEWVVLMEENAKTNLVARLNFMKSGSRDAQGS
jgi:gluconate kinase